MKKYYFILIFFASLNLFGQTVGVLRNDLGSYNGYTLLAPLTSNETYLINNCGEVVHQWSSAFTPAASAYLLENGNLLRTGKIENSNFPFGGVGGQIELFDWDGNLIWEYTYSSTIASQHHDIFPLPNGNILMLAATKITGTDAIQAGRDPSLMDDGEVFNEQILELEPVESNQATIVWEWNIQDHLIQDFDVTKDNFGVVADNPGLLNFNYINNDHAVANWLHCNSLQYNADLDQIILSSRIMSEVYIIDHSTTTLESASNSGGSYGKGGDFLYRWGNPEAYDHGTSTDRTLFGQHYPHWIADGLNDAGKIMIYNNGGDRGYSSIDIIDPPVSAPGVYLYDAIDGYAPVTANWSYTAPAPTDFTSAILSSGQRLANGNTLICDGDSGYFFEIDMNENIVWEYVNPDATSGPITQGDPATFNLVFRAIKFPLDFPAFDSRDLTPGNPIELNPDLSNCTLLSIADNELLNTKIYPNPTEGVLNISSVYTIDKVEIYSILGRLVRVKQNSNNVDLSNLSNGLYIAKIYANGKVLSKKIIKE